MRAERWLLFVVVVMGSLWMGAMSVYLITEGHRRCDDINRSNIGNRAAWDFMEQTVKANWVQNPPTLKQREATRIFFAGIHERLRPIDC